MTDDKKLMIRIYTIKLKNVFFEKVFELAIHGGSPIWLRVKGGVKMYRHSGVKVYHL